MTDLERQIAQAREIARIPETPGSMVLAKAPTSAADLNASLVPESEWFRLAVACLKDRSSYEYD